MYTYFFMKKKLLIFIITYKAKYRIKKVYNSIPFKKLTKFSTKVLISDDCSKDETINYIKKIKGKNIKKIFNAKNLGYGKNIKQCLSFAIKNNYDYAIMIHGDGQYHPKYMIKMLNVMEKDGSIKAVSGSRMAQKKDALKGNMPLYKFFGNIFLTMFANLITGKNFTDGHSGFWLYNVNTLKNINFKKIHDGFNFDQYIRFRYIKNNYKINEVPIKTVYGTERSSFHLPYAIRYFFEVLMFHFKK